MSSSWFYYFHRSLLRNLINFTTSEIRNFQKFENRNEKIANFEKNGNLFINSWIQKWLKWTIQTLNEQLFIKIYPRKSIIQRKKICLTGFEMAVDSFRCWFNFCVAFWIYQFAIIVRKNVSSGWKQNKPQLMDSTFFVDLVKNQIWRITLKELQKESM